MAEINDRENVGLGELLKQWGLEPLQKTFSDHGIDMEAMELLTPDIITDLIPMIGLRLKFLEKWKARFAKPEVLPVQLLPSTVEAMESMIQPASTSIFDDVVVQSASTSFSVEAMAPLASTSASVKAVAPSDDVTPPSAKKYKPTVHGLFDCKKILSESVDGRNAIKDIEDNGILKRSTKQTIVHILVGHLIKKHTLNPEAYEKAALAQSIITAFPCLEDSEGIIGYELFYMKGATGSPATGCLEEHLRYVRKKLKQKNDQKEQTTAKDIMNVDSNEMQEDSPIELTPELATQIEWLQSNNHPKHVVAEYMLSTAKYRQKWIRENRSISDILKEFPHLLNPNMIDQDFACQYPATSPKLKDKWSSMADSIIEYTKKMNKIWEDYINVQNDALSQDEKNNLAFLMLPFSFETRSKGKGKGRCTLRDSVMSFIDMQPEMISLPTYLGEIRAEKRPQPFILALYRENVLCPTQTFVIAERRAVEVSSLLEAVDICYKLVYILDVDYQVLCKGVWQFIEHIYEQPRSTKGILTPSIRAFRTYVQSCKSALNSDE